MASRASTSVGSLHEVRRARSLPPSFFPSSRPAHSAGIVKLKTDEACDRNFYCVEN